MPLITRFPSPTRLFFILLTVILLFEAVVMWLLPGIVAGAEHTWAAVIVDAALLALLVAPFLWLFIMRPLRSRAMVVQARAAAVVSNAVDGIIAINDRGLIESFNPAAEKIFGYSENEVLGKPLALLIPGRHRDAHQQGLERVRTTGKSAVVGKTLELHGLRHDGKEFPLELSISTWKAEKEMFFTGIVRDITERKRAEDVIHRDRIRRITVQDITNAVTSTLDLRAVLNTLLDKIDIHLPYAASSINLFNRETGELERLVVRHLDETAVKEVIERSGGGLARIVFEHKRLLKIRDVRADSRLPPVAEFFVKYGLVSYLGLPLIAKGEVLGVLGLLTKEDHEFSEEEIGFLSVLAGQAAMAIRNSELFEQTKSQAAELEKANEQQADFAAMIAHDLRSPLTSVVSTAAMLEDGLFGPVNQEQKTWLGKIGATVQNLVALVNDFLDLSKLESGRIDLAKEEVDLKQLVQNSLENYLPLSLDKKITLKKTLDPSLPKITADPRRLDQVLTNLLSNALKFTGEGGEIEMGARQENGRGIIAWVKDNGVGISADEIHQLFVKYKQAASAKSSAVKGTGLGLVICKMIVEAHGGKIWVESEIGKGTTFYLTLPLGRAVTNSRSS
jgi:PAS domain S-box-containing protein